MKTKTIIALLGSAFLTTLALPPTAQSASSTVSFKADVLPIFEAHCNECHRPGGEGHEESGLDLSTYQGVMKGTKFGAIVSPGDPWTSNLMAVIDGRTDASITMPHSKRRAMTKEDRRILRRWIIDGATKADYVKAPQSVIADLCKDCHVPGGMGYEASGFDVTSYETLMKGTDHGSVIVPGDPVMSNMMVLIDGRASGSLRMPHQEHSEPTAQERTKLRRWISQGAQDN